MAMTGEHGRIGAIFEGGTTLGLGPAELLDRFVATRDEEAFSALVAHHGPMVLATCRRILSNGADADDAFQATFLVFARKARSIHNADRLAPWLHSVARRVAVRSRTLSSRRRRVEGEGQGNLSAIAVAPPADDAREFRAVLDEELARLPEKYRVPLVLCYLQGLTHDEAAGQLAWPVGTVRSRMSQARDRLRTRLARRGFGSPESVATLTPATLPMAVVSRTLQVATVRLVLTGASGVATKSVAALLAQGVLTSMFLTKVQTVAVATLAAATTLAAGTAGVVARQEPAPAVGPAPTAAPVPPPTTSAESPVPSFTRINYAEPDRYLVLHPSFGDPDKIRQLAAPLRADSAEKTFDRIGRWITKTLKYDANAAYEYRDVDAACKAKVYGGCADHAIVFTALARACGIPAVFVKTMDVDWIREFRTTGTCKVWSGHVFLEVFVNGKWRLLDASAMQLYDDYTPTIRILPGNRYAYDKGSDPRELVLSPDWEPWKRQTAAYFARFNLAELPVGSGRTLDSDDDVYIAADSPIWQAITRRCDSLGYRTRTSFNTDYDAILPKARGKYLIVTSVGERVVPPAGPYGRYLPLAAAEIRQRIGRDGAGVARKRLDDGTRVVLLYAKDVAGLLKLVETWELGPVE